MSLQILLNQIQQEQQQTKESTLVKPRFNGKQVRHFFLKTLNKLVLESSFGKRTLILDEETVKVVELLCQYINTEPEFEKSGEYSLKKGIWIEGNFGSGKTQMITAFMLTKKWAGDLISMTTCRNINLNFQKMDADTKDRKRYASIRYMVSPTDKCERILDDLGAEETTINDFGNKLCVVGHVLLERYENLKNGLKTHVTTNLPHSKIEAIYGGRIASRKQEQFNVFQLGILPNSVDYRKLK